MLLLLLWLCLFGWSEVIVAGQQLSSSPSSPSSPSSSSSSSSSSSIESSTDGICEEYNRDCHCGTIAQNYGTSRYTRVVFANASTVIERYDDNVVYPYKYLYVFYNCTDAENVLVGKNLRECSRGHWHGPVPRCAINLRNEARLKQIRISDYRGKPSSSEGITTNASSGVRASSLFSDDDELRIRSRVLVYDSALRLEPSGVFDLPLKSQPTDCIAWPLHRRQVWSFALSQPSRTHYVRIKLYGDRIEDMHLRREISLQMSLRNISYYEAALRDADRDLDAAGVTASSADLRHIALPENFAIHCAEMEQKASQYQHLYKQKISPNYLVLDFGCELVENSTTIFEQSSATMMMPEAMRDYPIDQLYASVIEIRFTMHQDEDDNNEDSNNNNHNNNNNNNNQQQKRSTIADNSSHLNVSLCSLRLYAFNADCGWPDYPTNAFVKSGVNFINENVKETHEYSCKDKRNNILKGNAYIECGNYGRWRNEFPQCVRIEPCRLLLSPSALAAVSSAGTEYGLEVRYEKTINTKAGKMVPNGKYARVSCIRRRANRTTVTSTMSSASIPLFASTLSPLLGSAGNSKNKTKIGGKQTSVHRHQLMPGTQVTRLICSNGNWIGLKAVNLNCTTAAIKAIAGITGSGFDLTGQLGNESSAVKTKLISKTKTTSTATGTDDDDSDPSVQLVPLPMRLIRILLALFIILCLIIVSLLVYMCIFRHQMLANQSPSTSALAGSLKTNLIYLDGMDSIRPMIVYDANRNGSDAALYSSVDSELYERISLERFGGGGGGGGGGDSHLYQTIKTGGGGICGIGGAASGQNINYSDISTFHGGAIEFCERENSIYGMEEFDFDAANSGNDNENDRTNDCAMTAKMIEEETITETSIETTTTITGGNDMDNSMIVERRPRNDDETRRDENYHLLAHASTPLFVKVNSIYES